MSEMRKGASERRALTLAVKKRPFRMHFGRLTGGRTECIYVAVWPARARSRENPSVISNSGCWRRRLRLSAHAPQKRLREGDSENLNKGLMEGEFYPWGIQTAQFGDFSANLILKFVKTLTFIVVSANFELPHNDTG